MTKKMQLEYPINCLIEGVLYWDGAIKGRKNATAEEKANWEKRREDAIQEFSEHESLLPTFEFVLAQLTPQERGVVHFYHRDGLTMAQIGEKMELSSSRIGQLLHKAWRKLRYPKRIELIRKGISAYYEERMQTAYQNGVNDGYKQGYKEGYKKAYEDKLSEARVNVSEVPDVTIEELDLSVRVLNCLRRAGIHTLKDILKTNAGEIKNLAGFGKTSAEELSAALEKYHVSVDFEKAEYQYT